MSVDIGRGLVVTVDNHLHCHEWLDAALVEQCHVVVPEVDGVRMGLSRFRISVGWLVSSVIPRSTTQPASCIKLDQMCRELFWESVSNLSLWNTY